ncbi:hypothetical protein K458DRAFT_179749 [Lentithecium fluviatile CBS 122367]|uniref:Uncharacterized protein n=1 Tax=Lentithecium fluviatile CBS 122367 TaxID=1168545 RepID=A0A6G1IEX6_9PLEO|nr:hypothetical protein K458DRAFT_179749 [Lentithecium fluviatile CBS 122367]
MLIHRRIDEQCGKRRRSWIRQLRSQAEFLVEGTPTECFSSSKEDTFNESMKERALNEILPSLFDVAEAHEDYIAQYDLYEGSDNTDPHRGKYVTWSRSARPVRTHTKKRQCRPRVIKTDTLAPRDEPSSEEDSGEETEADELVSAPSTTCTSFQTLGTSSDEDVKPVIQSNPITAPTHLHLLADAAGDSELPPTISDHTQSMPTEHRQLCETSSANHAATLHLAVNQTLSRLHLSDMSDLDTKAEPGFETIGFPSVHTSYGNLGFQPYEGMALQAHAPALAPAPSSSSFYYTPFPSANYCAHHPPNVPSNATSATVMGAYPFQQMEPNLPQIQLPFGNYAYGTEHASTSGRPQDTMLADESICHGLPMDFPQ